MTVEVRLAKLPIGKLARFDVYRPNWSAPIFSTRETTLIALPSRKAVGGAAPTAYPY